MKRQKTQKKPSTQQSIPIAHIYENDIWDLGKQKQSRTYSFSWSFPDINYAFEKQEKKEKVLRSYANMVKSLPTDCQAKITIVNRSVGRKELEETCFISQQGEASGVLVQAVLTPDRANKRQNGRRIKEDGEPSFTLTCQDRHGILIGLRLYEMEHQQD